MSDSRPQDLDGWRQLLRHNWQKRADSDARDFYVASHPGWRDPRAWAAQAEHDVALICHGLEDAWLGEAAVLEIGCGVGRLVEPLLRRCRSYAGLDIAAGMVDEAQQRHADREACRFELGDGTSLPEAYQGGSFELIICIAVWIHCPLPVIEAALAQARSVLAPGGRLRFQLLADPQDSEGIAAPPAEVSEAVAQIEAVQHEAVEETQDAMELIHGHYYMGHAFRYAEAESLLAGFGDSFMLLRPDPHQIYCELRRGR